MVPDLTNPTQVVAGYDSTCALDDTGVVCWGKYGSSQERGVLRAEWLDADGDGVGHDRDAFPLDGSEWNDYDSDGIGDTADTDDDNDGIADTADAYPFDTDNDGVRNPDDGDVDGDGYNDWQPDPLPFDTDNDGLRNHLDSDDDGDGVLDVNDAFPLISVTGETDADADGAPDTCDDACVLTGMVVDAFSTNASETVDSDGDGTGNNADTDDDGDGVLDVDDAFPLDA
ncbi:uncharacterized protein METZ01_LOCUS493643, partial [marine metagenome]